MPDVRLVDLQLIRRYSLAIRQESADAAELLAVLESDRDQIEKLLSGRRSRPIGKAAPARRTTSARRAAGKAGKGSTGTTTKKTVTKTTAKRTGR